MPKSQIEAYKHKIIHILFLSLESGGGLWLAVEEAYLLEEAVPALTVRGSQCSEPRKEYTVAALHDARST